MRGSPRSTILGSVDVALVPFVYAAVIGLAVQLRTLVDAGPNGPDRLTLALASIGVLGGIGGAWWISRPSAARWRTRPEPYLAVAWIGAIFISVAASSDGGVSSSYLGTLIVGAAFFSLVMPRGWSLAALAGLIAGCVFTVLRSGASNSGALLIVVAMCGVAWWTGSIGHRAHERAARSAMLLSRADRLTGTLNRRGLLEVLDAELAARDGQQTAVVLFDLDGFKPVNDELGHAAGDRMLAWVGATLADVTGAGHEVGRLGGDEFAVVMPRATARDAAMLADRIVSALSDQIGATTGIAVAPGDGERSDELLRVADGRMYEAKGRIDRRRA